jgi:hypothetical protein
MLLAIAILLPLVFARQFNNVNQFDDFQNVTKNSFTIWVWTIMGIFVGFILAMVLSSCLNHQSRVNQFRANTRKLNEFNASDNPRGINWRIDSSSGYIDRYGAYSSYKHPREMYAQKVNFSIFFLSNIIDSNLILIILLF